MNARFISADGLSLDTEIQYPPQPKMARWMRPPINLSVIDGMDIPIEKLVRERFYELRGKSGEGIWIYEEIVN